MTRTRQAAALAVGLLLVPTLGYGQSTNDLILRLDRLEQENQALRRDLTALQTQQAKAAEPETEPETETGAKAPAQPRVAGADEGVVRINGPLSYGLLDPTTAGKSKPLALLAAKQDGTLKPGTVVLGGALTAIADYQWTNFDSDFGYLMRQPGANHIGQSVSEAAIHSAQIQVTASINPWLTTSVELLYDPQQSFAAGTITALARNQIQLRRGYALIGDLTRSPFFAMIGKFDTPFGQNDTVNPFSLSTDGHTFAGLAYGALVGYSKDGLNLSVEAAEGGSAFRGLNAPVDGTNVPSRLNNYVLDANYRVNLGGPNRTLLAGASYEKGSSYCQSFPITHFGACAKANPAYALYSTLDWDQFTLKGQYVSTVNPMPGTHNPNAPLDIYQASRISSYDVGLKHRTRAFDRPLHLSADFSTLMAGPHGAPWQHQDQWVAGIASYPSPNVKLFSEVIFVEGYLPFQFLTGGTPGDPAGETESDTGKRSQVLMTGITVGF
jgi:hypothetical protein